jgi:hypothetical protein
MTWAGCVAWLLTLVFLTFWAGVALAIYARLRTPAPSPVRSKRDERAKEESPTWLD